MLWPPYVMVVIFVLVKHAHFSSECNYLAATYQHV